MNFNTSIQPRSWKEAIIFSAVDPKRSKESRKVSKIGLTALAIIFTIATGGIGSILVYALHQTYTAKLKEIDEKAKEVIQSTFKGYSARNKFKHENEAINSFQSALRGFLVRKEMEKPDLLRRRNEIAMDIKVRKEIKQAIDGLDDTQYMVSFDLPFRKISLDVETLQGQLINGTWMIDLDKVGIDTYIRNPNLPAQPLLDDNSYIGPLQISFREALNFVINRINSAKATNGRVNIKFTEEIVACRTFQSLTNMDYISTEREREYLSFSNAALMILKEHGYINRSWEFGGNNFVQLPNGLSKLL